MTPDIIQKLADEGFDAQQIAAITRIVFAPTEASLARRAKDRERLRNWRETQRNGVKRVSSVSEPKTPTKTTSPKRVSETPLARGEDNLLLKEVTGKEKKKEIIGAREHLMAVLDDEHANAILEHRSRIRKPLTPHGAKLLAGQLSHWHDPNAAADEMILRGWQGFKPEWMTAGYSRAFDKPKKRTFADLALEAMNGGTYGPESLSRRDDNVVSLSTNQPISRSDDESLGRGSPVSFFRSNLQSF